MDSQWNELHQRLPDVGRIVLLHWPVPGMEPIYRLGSLLHKPFPTEIPIWRFMLDYGDAGAWVFTNRGDEQPTHWAEIVAPLPRGTECPSSHDGFHHVDTSMESGPNNCFHCERPMK